MDSGLWALEIKLTTRPNPDDMKRLNANAALVDADRRFLVCQHSDFLQSGDQVLCDLDGLIAHIEG